MTLERRLSKLEASILPSPPAEGRDDSGLPRRRGQRCGARSPLRGPSRGPGCYHRGFPQDANVVILAGIAPVRLMITR